MNNIHDIGVKPYQAAVSQQPPFSFAKIVHTVTYFVSKLIKYQCLSFVLWLQIIWELIIPRKPKSVKGQTALVTGGANGLGRALCIRLAQEGCNVVVVDVDDVNIKRTVADLQTFKIEAKGYKVDISDYEAVMSLKQTLDVEMGNVDILINNAGVLPRVSLMEGTEKDVQKIIDVNFTAQFWTIRAFLGDMMTRRKGHICAISSLCGIEAQAKMVAYSASKFAVSGLMDGVHEELTIKNLENEIHTTCCYPYFISTRQELIDSINESPFFSKVPVMTTTYTADVIIDGLLRNQHKVYVPGFLKTILFIHLNQPFLIRKLFRKIFFEEK